jgi:Arc/MetJ-type ribon-helix-helix transcriptional regulator
MNAFLPNDLRIFVQNKVQSGEFPSEEAVLEAALKQFREQKALGLEELIDHEFLEFCAGEGDDNVTLEAVLQATSSIPGSMSEAIIDDERADRI